MRLKLNRKLVIIIVAVVLVLALGITGAILFLGRDRDKGEKEAEEEVEELTPIDPPEEYTIGSESFPAMMVYGNVVVYDQYPEAELAEAEKEAAEKEAKEKKEHEKAEKKRQKEEEKRRKKEEKKNKDEDKEQEQEEAEATPSPEPTPTPEELEAEAAAAAEREKVPQTIYTYEGIQAPGSAIQGYTMFITSGENSFAVVDDTYHYTDAPDFTAPQGSERLVRVASGAAADEETGVTTLLVMEIAWDEEKCTVSLDSRQGILNEIIEAEGLTLFAAIDHFNALPPASLGLPGQSMLDYDVYALDGTVLVNGEPCLRLNVYASDTGSNQLMGMYLMTGDGLHVYRMDENTGEVTEMKI